MNDVSIRIATPQDAEKLLNIYAPYIKKTAITFEYEVPTEQEFARRIKNILEKYPYLVAEKEDEIVGYAYAATFIGRAASDWSVETSVYIREDQKAKGAGRKLYEALEQILAMQDIQNLNASIAYIEDPNPYVNRNSVQFHEHMGYRKIGQFHKCGYKFGYWYDLIWMEKHIGEHTEKPLAVKSFDEIRQQAEKFILSK